VRNARELTKVGATLEVTILALDRERRRISLGWASVRTWCRRKIWTRPRAPAHLGTLGDLFKKKL